MNNQPAFPENYVNGSMSPGMTLRDYFAAKAMQGLLSSFGLEHTSFDNIGHEKKAYEIADAMLKAREP